MNLIDRALDAHATSEAEVAARLADRLPELRRRADDTWQETLGQTGRPDVTDWQPVTATGTWLAVEVNGLRFIARPAMSADPRDYVVRPWELVVERRSDHELLEVRSLPNLGRLLALNGVSRFTEEPEPVEPR